MRQQCRHFRALGSCAGIPRERFPEGFPRCGAGGGSGWHLSSWGILWKGNSLEGEFSEGSAEEEAGLLPCRSGSDCPGKRQGQSSAWGVSLCQRVTLLKQNLKFALEVSLLQQQLLFLWD